MTGRGYIVLMLLAAMSMTSVLSQPTTQTLTTKTKATLSPTTTFVNLGPGQTAIKVMMAAVTAGVPEPTNPKIFSKPGLPGQQAGANFCKNPYDLETVWCFNQPSKGFISYLQFNYVKFAQAGTYYFGMYYSTAQPSTLVTVEVNGVQQFGYVPTPSTGAWYSMATTVAEKPFTVAAPISNTIKVSAQQGRVNIEYIIISTVPITSTAPPMPALNATIVPATETLVFASSYASAVGFINPKADQSFAGSAQTNFCFSKVDTRIESWCMNAPINGSEVSSLTFNYNFPATNTYYFGVYYASNYTASRLRVYVDGVETWGYVPTPSTGSYSTFQKSASNLGVVVKGGGHTIKLVVALGRIDVYYFVIGTAPISNAYTLPPVTTTQPPGQETISATTYTSAVGTPDVLQADYTFPGHAVVNFCLSHFDPSLEYWCYNSPVNNTATGTLVQSSLTFTYNFPGNGTYYFGLNYASTEAFSVVNVYLNGQQSWGFVPTPVTGNRETFVTTVATQSALVYGGGTQTIQIVVAKGAVSISSFIISSNPIVVTAATVPPIQFTGTQWIVSATSYTKAVGIPHPLADPTFPGAATTNFCRNVKNPTQEYWCFNMPINQALSSLTFNFNFPYPGTFYFGLDYATADPIAVIDALLDGVRQWGPVATPKTGNWYIFQVGGGAQPVIVTSAGWHTIDLYVTKGSVNVLSFIISTTAIPSLAVLPTVPAGETIVQAETFVSAVGVPNPHADQFFPGKDLANFCISAIDPSVEYWCYNRPINGSMISSLTFNYRFASAGTYYFAASYATNATRSLMNVYIDGVQNFGFFSTPATGSWTDFQIATASQGAVVKNTNGAIHTIELEIAFDEIHVDYFIISTHPIVPTITTPPPIIPTTPPGGVVLQHVNYNSNATGITSISAMVGVVVALLAIWISQRG